MRFAFDIQLNLQSHAKAPYLFHPLQMELLNLLDLVVTTHEDTGLVVDALGHHLEHTVHLAVDSLATG